MSNAAATPESEGQPKAHPKGLYVLFGAEAWERFSYYGMRALLTLYLTKHLGYERRDALGVYGMYTALVYLTPLIGGTLADKLLGRRKAVLIGGALMMLGHLAMAFESLLYPALGLLVAGNGFFKPNISTIVGGLYGEGDARRDGAFTIFYMGINLGAFLAPIVCGTLGEQVSWHYGFSAAAVGMAAGLSVFVWGQKLFGSVGLPPRETASTEPDQRPVEEQVARGLSRRDYVEAVVWTVGIVALVMGILGAWKAIGPMWSATSGYVKLGVLVALMAGVRFQLFRGATREEAQRLRVVIILFLFNICFWMGFEQAGGTFTLFADQQTNRDFGYVQIAITTLALWAAAWNVFRGTRKEAAGRPLFVGITIALSVLGIWFAYNASRQVAQLGHYTVTASQFQAINPLLIVALGPTFSRMWLRLDSGRFRTSTPTKMAFGLILLGLGFVVMYIGQGLASGGHKVSAGWLAGVYLLHTLGELCLSPIGLSMITKLAPDRVVSLAMGVWLLSSAFANYLAATLEGMLEHYHVPLYGFLVGSSIGPALLLLAMVPLLKRWMHGRA